MGAEPLALGVELADSLKEFLSLLLEQGDALIEPPDLSPPVEHRMASWPLGSLRQGKGLLQAIDLGMELLDTDRPFLDLII